MTTESLHQVSSGRERDIDETHATQELTTAYIHTMYYSALSNLYLQSVLPDEIEKIEGQMPPRLEVAIERSYVDFNDAADWLAKNGTEFIDTSSAKQLYEEVHALSENVIVSVSTFLASVA